MTLNDWVRESVDGLREHGLLTGTRFAVEEFGVGFGRRLGQRLNYGRPVWEHNWDVLVILDACRWDLMQAVSPAWEFLPDEVPATYAPASMSEEWLERHVDPGYNQEIEQTAMVTANPFTRNDWVRNADWTLLDEVWTHSWDDEHGTILPRSVTDRAIDHWRTCKPPDDHPTEQMIVWYLQPHAPFIDTDWSEGFDQREIGNGGGVEKSVWYQYRDGDLSRQQLWDAYRKNLNHVLQDVELLLENIAAENVVITSDHANCLGEWGVYGHPKYVPVPTLKRVPWVETTACDFETHEPAAAPDEEPSVSDADVDDRLRDLGYLE